MKEVFQMLFIVFFFVGPIGFFTLIGGQVYSDIKGTKYLEVFDKLLVPNVVVNTMVYLVTLYLL